MAREERPQSSPHEVALDGESVRNFDTSLTHSARDVRRLNDPAFIEHLTAGFASAVTAEAVRTALKMLVERENAESSKRTWHRNYYDRIE
jgi:hypothetical protein